MLHSIIDKMAEKKDYTVMKKNLYSCSAVLLLFFSSSALALESSDYLRMLSPSQGKSQAPIGRTRGIAGQTTFQDAPAPSNVVSPDTDFHEVAMHLQFELGSARLTAQSRMELEKLAAALGDDSLRNYKFKIEGHTCDRGSAAYNLSLSEKRAQNVADFLAYNSPLGVEQFEVEGYGESAPAVPNIDEQSRRQNRRVIIRNTLATVADDGSAPVSVGRTYDGVVSVAVDAAPSASTPSVSSAGMQIFRYEAGGATLLKQGEELNSGDHYAVTFMTGSHRYAYVCQKDSMGAVSLLFPDLSDKKNPVAPKTKYRVPANGDYFTLDNTVGKEQILLLAFDNKLSDPEQACRSTLTVAEAANPGHRGVGGVTGLKKTKSIITGGEKNIFPVQLSCIDTKQMGTRGVAGVKKISQKQLTSQGKCQGIALKRFFMHK